MSAGTISSQSNIQDILRRCRRQILMHNLLTSLALLCTVLIGSILLATGTDLLIGLPSTIRLLLLIAGAAAVVYVLVRHVAAAWQISIPAAELGAAVDLTAPELQESLTTLLSLNRPDVTSGEAGSAVMRAHLQEQVTGRLVTLRQESFVDARRTLKWCAIALLLIAAALLPATVWPSSSQLLLARLFQPFGNFDTVTDLYFEIPNGNRTVARGSDVAILARPQWRSGRDGGRPEDVVLEVTTADGRRDQRPMSYDETDGRFVATLPDIRNSLQYRVSSGRTASQQYNLNVVDAPEIIAAVMTATPPVYTGRAIERFDGMVGQLDVFERSDLDVHLEFSKPVRSATLVWVRRDERPLSDIQAFDIEFDHVTGEIIEVDPEDLDPDAPLTVAVEELPARIPLQLTADATGARLSLTADVGGEFVFEVLDEFDLQNPVEPERYLHVEYDQAPQLQVSGLRDGDGLRPDDILPVNCRATDDIGLGSLELHYRINDGVMKIVPAQGLERGAQLAEEAFRLPLEELSVQHDDRVTVRVRTTDERPEPGPHEVWSRELTLRIDNDAKAAGADALDEATQKLVDQLKKLEAELHSDAHQAREIRQQAEQEWTDSAREQTQELSEKEQQQGRQLEQIADEVATHPLMQDAAQALHQVSEQLQQQIPDKLQEAQNRDRRQATQQLDDVGKDLREAAQEVAKQIGEILDRARLEQNLAELNRLALEAEQLALQAEQLEKDQQKAQAAQDAEDQSPPNEQNPAAQQELDRRQQQLNQQQQQLRNDIGQLLQQENELLKSAQQSQQNQLAELADQTRQLAAAQKKLADGVQQEAKEAGRQANDAIKKIERARRDAEKVNRDLNDLDKAAAAPDLQPLKQAVDALRKGDLNESSDRLGEVAKQFRQTEAQLQSPPAADDKLQSDATKPSANANDNGAEQADSPGDAAAEPNDADGDPEDQRRRRETGKAAGDVADQLDDIRRDLEQQRSERSAAPADAADSPAGDDSNQSNPAATDEALRTPVNELLQRLDQLQTASAEAANDLQQKTDDRNAQRQSKNAAGQVASANQEAMAGQFDRTADQLRKASGSAANASKALPAAEESERREQLQKLSEELGRVASQADALKRDDAAQAAAQQQSQTQIADQARQLPQQLDELAERLGLPELQLPQQAEQAGAAQQAAAAAGQASQRANENLQQADLQQAAQSGREAANQLNQAANLSQQAAGDSNKADTAVPTQVGERVAEALQQLQQAAQAMQSPQSGSPPSENAQAGQQSEQSANGQNSPQDGEGQPTAQSQPGQSGQPGEGQNAQQGQAGQGSSGSQQLSDAAQALADAAENALPSQFNPGQLNEGSSGAQGSNAMGNAAMWNGQLPGQSDGPAGSRDWGALNEELQTETADQLGVSRDSEYEALIRMYFREVAKAAAR